MPKLPITPLIVLTLSFVVACVLAAIFSGSVVAPLTACPVAVAGGGVAGWLLIREDR